MTGNKSGLIAYWSRFLHSMPMNTNMYIVEDKVIFFKPKKWRGLKIRVRNWNYFTYFSTKSGNKHNHFNLKIERGRFSKLPIPVENRFCDHCLSEIEDEFHFLIKCSKYKSS